MNKFVGFYRTFRHNLLYKDGFYKKIMITLVTLLLINLIILYFVW